MRHTRGEICRAAGPLKSAGFAQKNAREESVFFVSYRFLFVPDEFHTEPVARSERFELSHV